MTTVTQKFDWAGELEKTVTNSLATSFGLDFLLVEDKYGGDVDTIHNVRQGVWATEKAKSAYEQRGAYDSHAYHSDANYKQRGRADKAAQQAGQLHDAYRGQKMKRGENRQLDHVIAASEIHHDAGRVLAGLDGVALANQDSNLISTHGYVNNLKRAHKLETFVKEIAPKKVQELQRATAQDLAKLKSMPQDTPKNRHEYQQLKSKIDKNQDKIDALEQTIKNKDQALEAERKARQEYDSKINKDYYTSSEFFKDTANAAAISGLQMGLRETIGLLLREIWFELRKTLPRILQKCKHNFSLEIFTNEIGQSLRNIVDRVKVRFKELFQTFKDGFIGGVLSSITTTIINIFFTTSKMIGKLIRETWQNAIKIAKLIFFNPDKLSTGQLMREVLRLILMSAATIVGVVAHRQLSTMMVFPFGSEIAAFLSALLTGILMVGISYFIDYSEIMQKVWKFLDRLKGKYDHILDNLKQVNAELDAYLQKLAQIEFSLNTVELRQFSDSLIATNDEFERGKILKAQVEKMEIKLPYEIGDNKSIAKWLKELE